MNAPCDVEGCADTETLPLTQDGYRPTILCGPHLITEIERRGRVTGPVYMFIETVTQEGAP